MNVPLLLRTRPEIAVEGVLGGRLHRPLAVVLGDRRVRAVLLRLGPVLKSQLVICVQNSGSGVHGSIPDCADFKLQAPSIFP